MSGAEPLAVLGAISSVIAIIETCRELVEAAKDARGLHDTFRKASENIPVILDTLREAEKVQEQAKNDYVNSDDAAQRDAIEKTSQAVTTIMATCQSNAVALKQTFEKLLAERTASSLGRYTQAISSINPSKKRKVENLLREILEKLQLLQTYQFFKSMARSGDLSSAIERLSDHLACPQSVSQTYSGANPGIRGGATLPVRSDNTPTASTDTRSTDGNVYHMVWNNSDGTKVMNQGHQTINGTQNITL